MHALYKASRSKCDTLEEAADWYIETRYTLRQWNITDTRLFFPGQNEASIDDSLERGGYDKIFVAN